MSYPSDHLRAIHNFDDLVLYLEERLGWPLQEYGFDDLTFQYEPEELGLKNEDAAKVKAIHQLRPLQHGQPWGIFFVEFEKKKLPVVVLRRILSHLVVKKRASANRANEAAWHANDLLFVTAFGEEDSSQREIAFAHFHQSAGDLPTLRVLGWDGGDTPLKLSHLDAVLQKRLHWPDNASDHDAWREQWRAPFKHRIGHVIRTADSLAEALAALARGIHDKAKRMLAAESETGPLRKLHKAFQTALIHDLTEENFADTYAQTITYGLLTAAISRTEGSEGRHGTFIVAENVTDMVPVTNPFLREMLQTFLKVGGRKGGIDFDELGIQDVVDLLRGDETDLPAILRDFGNKTQGEDPVIHFYEHFLSAYNKKLKVQRGVFYTPKPAVSYIVRSVHELLQTKFGLEDGLASIVTWGEMTNNHPEIKIPSGISPDSFFVMVLDPATGTATFLVEVIDIIHKTMTAKWQQQGKRDEEINKLWNEYIPKYLLPRLHGYELMMAPYAIAHMKIGLKLFETGYQFMSDERVRVYLTNALEPASNQLIFEGILPALAHEAKAVNEIKRKLVFTVVVGNPPYASVSSNMTSWIRDETNNYLLIEGARIQEKSKRNHLQNDYIKFIRMADLACQLSPMSVFGFVTSNSYLDGRTLRGLRWNLLQNYHHISILNLFGDSKKRDASSDDENIFDITEGVSILLATRNNKLCDTTVVYTEMQGTRQFKYNQLLKAVPDNSFVQIPVTPPHYLFKTAEGSIRDEFLALGPSLDQIYRVNGAGLKTNRDAFATDEDREVLLKRMFQFADKTITDEEIRSRFELKDNYTWKLPKARADFMSRAVSEKKIVPLTYRPFDKRFVYFDKSVVFNPRFQIMNHLLRGDNLAIVSIGQNESTVFNHAFVCRNTAEIKMATHYGASVVFPMYLYPDPSEMIASGGFKNSNLTVSANNFVVLANKACLEGFSTDSIVIHYIYAILYSQTYRDRYAEPLMMDFPRVPQTSSLELFRSLAKLGGELIAMHLLESHKINNFITTFVGKGDNFIPKKPTWKENTVWINTTQRFEGVPEKVWNFHIGGYQVCEKWLKDRKGRTLSNEDITHYQRIVVALNETIRIMAEIDHVIDEHGGWPIK
jgi:hypothetical protein